MYNNFFKGPCWKFLSVTCFRWLRAVCQIGRAVFQKRGLTFFGAASFFFFSSWFFFFLSSIKWFSPCIGRFFSLLGKSEDAGVIFTPSHVFSAFDHLTDDGVFPISLLTLSWHLRVSDGRFLSTIWKRRDDESDSIHFFCLPFPWPWLWSELYHKWSAQKRRKEYAPVYIWITFKR